MCDFTPLKEHQIDAKLNQLYDLYNKCQRHIESKTSAIDDSLSIIEDNVLKLSENFDVVMSLNARLCKVEESLENINRFIQDLSGSLPRQFLQTYMLCKEETLAIIEDTVVREIKKLRALNSPTKQFHELIVTPESYRDIMNDTVLPYNKIIEGLPMTIENCLFICPNWQFNILTDKGSSLCEPIGLTFYEFIFNFSNNCNAKYVYDNLVIDKDYIRNAIKGRRNKETNMSILLQFTQFYQLILLREFEFIKNLVDDIDQLMSFLHYICSTYTVYRIHDKVVAIR